MSEYEELLSAIKGLEREIIEARNMNIKTDNNMRSLFAELKKVSANQQTASKKARIGSFGAYIIFVVILGAAAILLSNLNASVSEEKINDLTNRIRTAREETRSLKLGIEARDSAEKRSFHVLQLIRADKKKGAVGEFRKIDKGKLSKTELELLRERIDGFSSELAGIHYEKGVSQWRIGGYKNAIQEFEASLGYVEKPDFAAMQSYYLGLSRLKTEAVDKGIKNLKAASTGDLPRNITDKARIEISEVLIRSGRFREALNYMEGIPMNVLGFFARQSIAAKIRFAKSKLAEKEGAKP